MCEASVYISQNDEEVLVMPSVDVIEPDGDDRWQIVDIFGNQKTINGRIKIMNLVDHRVVFMENG